MQFSLILHARKQSENMFLVHPQVSPILLIYDWFQWGGGGGGSKSYNPDIFCYTLDMFALFCNQTEYLGFFKKNWQFDTTVLYKLYLTVYNIWRPESHATIVVFLYKQVKNTSVRPWKLLFTNFKLLNVHFKFVYPYCHQILVLLLNVLNLTKSKNMVSNSIVIRA